MDREEYVSMDTMGNVFDGNAGEIIGGDDRTRAGWQGKRPGASCIRSTGGVQGTRDEA